MKKSLLSNIPSYALGVGGICLGFLLSHGIAMGLTGGTYLLGFIPVLLLGSAVLGTIGFVLGDKLCEAGGAMA